MLERLKATLHQAITTERGDRVAPLRVSKNLARRLNVTLGYPLDSVEGLERRRAAQARLTELRAVPTKVERTKVATPITIYAEKGRNDRMLARAEELLTGKGYAYRVLDVTDDEATMTFVTRKASCQPEDLPVIFVGPDVLGGYAALVEADVDGSLAKSVLGA